MLAIAQFAGNATFTKITGVEGVVCGFSSVYLGVAEILNESYKKNVLPIYPTS
jgi:hypothetical protein